MSTSVQGVNDGAGFGVSGTSGTGVSGHGVIGSTHSRDKFGIHGIHTATGDMKAVAVKGEIHHGHAAIVGQTAGGSPVDSDEPNNSGVLGESARGPGVTGMSSVAPGLLGFGPVAVRGSSTKTDQFDPQGIGVHGISTAATAATGVPSGIGVLGEGGEAGVHGKSDRGNGVKVESGGNEPALLVDYRGDGTAVHIRQFRSGADLLVCTEIAPSGSGDRGVFRVLNGGEVLATGDVKARGVTLTCDRNAKANLTSVDAQQILQKLTCMPIQNWSYKTDPASVRHIGPTSQDFQSAFGLNGGDDVHISAVDAQGIALAAIQGLNEKLQAENAELRTNLASLEARLTALESIA